jgi:hypothetical protein
VGEAIDAKAALRLTGPAGSPGHGPGPAKENKAGRKEIQAGRKKNKAGHKENKAGHKEIKMENCDLSMG